MAGWLESENGARIEDNVGAEVKWSFTEFLKAFLEHVYGSSCLRPLPSVVGEGQVVDLLKLKIAVRKRGGYCGVSENGLWSSVAADCGLDSRFSAALKLVYVKYLDALDRWLRKIEKYREDGVSEERCFDFTWFLMGLESGPKVFVSSKIERDDGFVELKKTEFEVVDGNQVFVELNIDVEGSDEKGSDENGVSDGVNIGKEQSVDKGGDGDDLRVDQDSVSKKRKRECYTGLLNWIRNVGKDPNGPAVEPLPEMQKWNCYGRELPWKQILTIREAMLLKKNVDAGSQRSVWQVCILLLPCLVPVDEYDLYLQQDQF